jgi:hypothetical protein
MSVQEPQERVFATDHGRVWRRGIHGLGLCRSAGESERLHIKTLLEGSLSRTYTQVMRQISFVLAAGLTAALLVGCATNDYSRITAKIAAYDTEAAKTKADMAKATDDAARILAYRTLISLTEKQLMIARRISPSTNPGYRAGTMTIEQARQDRENRIAQLDKQLKTYQSELGKVAGRPST